MRDCPESAPVDAGVEVVLEEPADAVGYCTRLRENDAPEPGALRRVGADGVARFPVDGPLEGYASVWVVRGDEQHCSWEWFAPVSYNGTGVLSVAAPRGQVCA